MARSTRPRPSQVSATAAVVRWYFETHHGRGEDLGSAAMYCDRARVGHFAVNPADLAAGRPAALFRVLIATTLFQRRQDRQVLRILQGIARDDAVELSSARRLIALVDACECPYARTVAALEERCDLTKSAGRGTCKANRRVACHMKRHTVQLKRYGHFGKVPSSAALVLREAGARDLRALRARVLAATASPQDRAVALERVLMRAWRVSDKIAAMFLSAISNPDLSPGLAPWSEGIDWTRYVLVDSNVDLFLASIRYRGPASYDARREFVQALARRIDLQAYRPGFHAYNPRLVQQAMYMFMSRTNRIATTSDCSHHGPGACRACPTVLSSRCLARRA